MRCTTLLFFLFIIPALTFSQNSNSLQSSDHQIHHEDLDTDPFTSYMMNIDNPCKDSLYLELKKMPLDDMSDRQYEVFKQKDKACQEYMNTVEASKPANKSAEAAEDAQKAMTTYYVIAGIVSLASLIYLFSI